MRNNDMSNRRVWPRVNEQIQVKYEHADGEGTGVTLNISEEGARLVMRHPVASSFPLMLPMHPEIRVEATPVWTQILVGGGRIVGVRFEPRGEERKAIRSYIEQRQAP